MQAVDEFLEPLTEDYVTLYKENALLKSKIRVLVEKLEEYRANEASMKDAIINAQKTCDLMVKEAESKCTQMLSEANVAAAANQRSNEAVMAAENQRVEDAKKAAGIKIQAIESQLQDCIKLLARIREENRPSASAEAADAETAVANEISENLANLVGTTEDVAPKAPPKHPVSDTTGKFANLQFGRNYDPTHK
jgi:cell division initiation protein